MTTTPSPEALAHLAALASERGIHPDTLLSDFFNADARFRKVQGRTVVSSEAGVPALADKCNELLTRRPDCAKTLRSALLVTADIKDTDIGATLADAIVVIGRRKKAREVVAVWNRVENRLRPAP